MPELPEVESVRQSLLAKVKNKIIVSFTCERPEILLLRAEEIKNADVLPYRRIEDIERRGKYLLWRLSELIQDLAKSGTDSANKDNICTGNAIDGKIGIDSANNIDNKKLILLMHLRMTGRCLYYPEALKGEALAAHTHIRMGLAEFDDNCSTKIKSILTEQVDPQTSLKPAQLQPAGEIRWQDVRRFGRWELFTEESFESWDKGVAALGLEPFAEALNAQYLQQFSRKHAKLKLAQVLLDQRCIAGLGNIYVQELLYLTRFSPLSQAAALSLRDWEKIRVAMRVLLSEAIAARGTSFSDYVDGDGLSGRFQERLHVYGRKGEACRSCGKPLQAAVLSGRRMAFCPHCQKLKEVRAKRV